MQTPRFYYDPTLRIAYHTRGFLEEQERIERENPDSTLSLAFAREEKQREAAREKRLEEERRAREHYEEVTAQEERLKQEEDRLRNARETEAQEKREAEKRLKEAQDKLREDQDRWDREEAMKKREAEIEAEFGTSARTARSIEALSDENAQQTEMQKRGFLQTLAALLSEKDPKKYNYLVQNLKDKSRELQKTQELDVDLKLLDSRAGREELLHRINDIMKSSPDKALEAIEAKEFANLVKDLKGFDNLSVLGKETVEANVRKLLTIGGLRDLQIETKDFGGPGLQPEFVVGVPMKGVPPTNGRSEQQQSQQQGNSTLGNMNNITQRQGTSSPARSQQNDSLITPYDVSKTDGSFNDFVPISNNVSHGPSKATTNNSRASSRYSQHKDLIALREADIMDAMASNEVFFVRKAVDLLWPIFDPPFVEFCEKWIKDYVAGLDDTFYPIETKLALLNRNNYDKSPIRDLSNLTFDQFDRLLSSVERPDSVKKRDGEVFNVVGDNSNGPTPTDSNVNGNMGGTSPTSNNNLHGSLATKIVRLPADFDFLSVEEKRDLLKTQQVLDADHGNFKQPQPDFPFSDMYSTEPTQPLNRVVNEPSLVPFKSTFGPASPLKSQPGSPFKAGPGGAPFTDPRQLEQTPSAVSGFMDTGSVLDANKAGSAGNDPNIVVPHISQFQKEDQGFKASPTTCVPSAAALQQAISAMGLELRLTQEAVNAKEINLEMEPLEHMRRKQAETKHQVVCEERDYWKKESLALYSRVAELEREVKQLTDENDYKKQFLSKAAGVDRRDALGGATLQRMMSPPDARRIGAKMGAETWMEDGEEQCTSNVRARSLGATPKSYYNSVLRDVGGIGVGMFANNANYNKKQIGTKYWNKLKDPASAISDEGRSRSVGLPHGRNLFRLPNSQDQPPNHALLLQNCQRNLESVRGCIKERM